MLSAQRQALDNESKPYAAPVYMSSLRLLLKFDDKIGMFESSQEKGSAQSNEDVDIAATNIYEPHLSKALKTFKEARIMQETLLAAIKEVHYGELSMCYFTVSRQRLLKSNWQ